MLLSIQPQQCGHKNYCCCCSCYRSKFKQFGCVKCKYYIIIFNEDIKHTLMRHTFNIHKNMNALYEFARIIMNSNTIVKKNSNTCLFLFSSITFGCLFVSSLIWKHILWHFGLFHFCTSFFKFDFYILKRYEPCLFSRIDICSHRTHNLCIRQKFIDSHNDRWFPSIRAF